MPNGLNRTPQESADELAEAAIGLTNALTKLRRRFRWIIAAVAALSLTLSATIYFNYNGTIDRCEAGNELRAEISLKFDKLAEPLTAGGVGESPEGQELLITLQEDLEPRDCESINWLGR